MDGRCVGEQKDGEVDGEKHVYVHTYPVNFEE